MSNRSIVAALVAAGSIVASVGCGESGDVSATQAQSARGPALPQATAPDASDTTVPATTSEATTSTTPAPGTSRSAGPAPAPTVQVAALTDEAQESSKPLCRRFESDIAGYETGVGLDQLARQARTYREARARLAQGLLDATSGADRLRVANYANMLVNNNELLFKAEAAALDGDVDAAYAATNAWSERLATESSLVRRLELELCPR